MVADAQYGTNENFAACHGTATSDSHMKDFRSTQRNDAAKRGIFKQTDFRYDEETQTLHLSGREAVEADGRIDRGFHVFESNARICRDCALRAHCMKSKRHERTLKRHVAHDAIERARLESHSGWARRDRRRRQHLMEGSFADAANHHGFKRARWRRLHNQHVQDLLIATCQNIRILISKSVAEGRGNGARLGLLTLASSRGLFSARQIMPFAWVDSPRVNLRPLATL